MALFNVCCFCFDIRQGASIVAWILLVMAVIELSFTTFLTFHTNDPKAATRKENLSVHFDKIEVTTKGYETQLSAYLISMQSKAWTRRVGEKTIRIYYAVGILINLFDAAFQFLLIAAIGKEKKSLLFKWLVSYAIFFSAKLICQVTLNVVLGLVAEKRVVYLNWVIIGIRLLIYVYFYFVMLSFYSALEEYIDSAHSSVKSVQHGHCSTDSTI